MIPLDMLILANENYLSFRSIHFPYLEKKKKKSKETGTEIT